MAKRIAVAASLVLALLVPALAARQSPAAQAPPAAAAGDEKPEEGIPIASEAVQKACRSCHRVDDQKRMTRISHRRTTPEGWQQAVRRMVSLNDAVLDPDEAREVVKYLANHLGLAPDEARIGAFEVERRMIEYKYASDKDTEQTCTKCHSFGRVLLERRTKEEWDLLIAMHRGFYPLVDFQAFRRVGPPQREPGPDGRPPDNRHPYEKAVAHLSATFPLRTPEWAAWSATMRPPRLQGRWAVAGYQAGRGPVYGIVTIAPKPGADDEFTTDARLVFPRSGQTLARAGRAIVYTGFQWRGSSSDGSADAPRWREVLLVERDWRQMSGRWFTGAYDETGIDVKLVRAAADPIVLGAYPTALNTGATHTVRIFGANLPASPAAADLNFGPGVTIARVASAAPDQISVDVQVAADAPVGARDVFVAGASRDAAVTVYDHIDAIKVLPQAGMARVGGVTFPKGYQQFEAVAYHNGADGKPDTKDDLNLGLVEASWAIEEYTAVLGDEDKAYVGAVDHTGLFTPSEDGPNPKRRGNANNIGDVWVVATLASDGGSALARPLRARAHLLVTVPLYMKWDTTAEVSR